eukprot:3901291-Pleurochrysis_carterae.AAC.2
MSWLRACPTGAGAHLGRRTRTAARESPRVRSLAQGSPLSACAIEPRVLRTRTLDAWCCCIVRAKVLLCTPVNGLADYVRLA